MLLNLKNDVFGSFFYVIIVLQFYNIISVVDLKKPKKNPDAKLIKLIKEHTNASRNHLVPEIELYLAPFKRPKNYTAPFVYPWWIYFWPGGQALARYILDNSDIVKQKSVLDVGCGCGANAIAAAMSNAQEVVANDVDHVCLVASKLNAELNNVSIKYNQQDLVGEKIPHDCILVGDVFIYDDEFCARLFVWLYSLMNEGKTVLVGDAGRVALMNDDIQQHLKFLAHYEMPYPQELNLNVSAQYFNSTVWLLV